MKSISTVFALLIFSSVGICSTNANVGLTLRSYEVLNLGATKLQSSRVIGFSEARKIDAKNFCEKARSLSKDLSSLALSLRQTQPKFEMGGMTENQALVLLKFQGFLSSLQLETLDMSKSAGKVTKSACAPDLTLEQRSEAMSDYNHVADRALGIGFTYASRADDAQKLVQFLSTGIVPN